MKVIIPVSYNVNMKLIYSQVKPLIPKREFLKRVRNEVNQYVQARLDASTETDSFGLEDMINSLVDAGYAEYIEH